MELLNDMNVDICGLSETWLHVSDNAIFSEIKDFGFLIHSKPRAGRGGGVGILYRSKLKLSPCKVKQFKSFECCEATFKSTNGVLTRISIMYRSGTATSMSSNTELFLEEFEDYLNTFIEKPGKPIIMGDFNIHVEDPTCSFATRFCNLLEKLDWIQHINVPTHVKGGTLDLVISKKSSSSDYISFSNFYVTADTGTSSDHYLVTYNGNVSAMICKPNLAPQPYRKIKAIDITEFKSDVSESSLCSTATLSEDNDKTVSTYDSELRKILDKHAPLKWFSPKPWSAGWWNSACQQARVMRRHAERRLKLDDPDSVSHYKKCCKEAANIINEQRTSFFRNRLNECQNNPKKTFALVDKLLDKAKIYSVYPTATSDLHNAESFKSFFQSKIETIYDNIIKERKGCQKLPVHQPSAPKHQNCKMDAFCPVSETELMSIIKDLSSKHCDLDPIPTRLMLECLPELLPLLLQIVNASLQSGKFPTDLKEGLIRPSLKKEDLDPENMKNYRPISNLSFLSKVIEKCVAIQVSKYLEENNLLCKFQSGYRRYHSCETATTRIHNDILVMCDRQSKVVLLLLDLSAAFDTVNHSMLLKKLNHEYGISGVVLQWMESYLSGRTFSVKVNSSRSGKSLFIIGVPQGSILGPLLFILYTKELETIAMKHGFEIHIYADDTQLYFTFDSSDQNSVELRAMRCMQEIKDWMCHNFLQLNESKTDIIILSSKSDSSNPVACFQAVQGCKPLKAKEYVKSLGVRLDNRLNLSHFISATIASCNISLRNLWKMANKLTFKLKIQLVHAMILSRLDYCNSILYGISVENLQRLQKVQNCAVRFIFNKSKRSHASNFLKEVHFLPIRFRILYKINMLIYKCINNMAPSYLQDLIQLRFPTVNDVRLNNDYFMLEHPPLTTFTSTTKAFSYCAPLTWNCLPYELRSCENISLFKKRLKTHYFDLAFSE